VAPSPVLDMKIAASDPVFPQVRGRFRVLRVVAMLWFYVMDDGALLTVRESTL
jgi:hypothetical protein